MKRYRATITIWNNDDLMQFDAKVSSDKLKFEDSVIYKDLKKDLENAQKTYNQSLADEKLDEAVYFELLQNVQSVFNTLINSQIVVKCEDSGVICPQLGKRVLFIENYKEVDIFEKDVIQLTTPFYFDTGAEIIIITKDNYKDYDIDKILIEKPDKYKEVK